MPWPTAKCGHCPRLIVWARTDAGKPMPVDADYSTAGNVMLYRDDDGVVRAKVGKAGQLPMDAPPGAELHMPHFATCTGWPKKRRG